MGCLGIDGSALISGKVKIMGKLQVVGNFHAEDEIEVWGAVIINGHMKCKKLTAYGSVTTVGDQSWYEVEESETVYGAKLIQTNDYDG
jgi:cytoskeletal protein CcmA (bactofilin family)